MHITTHHIPAKRRHIDAATRLRRLSHVVAASTRVVRGCKLPPPPLTKRNTPNCFITALGSDRSGLRLQHATCAPLGLTAAGRGFARAYGSTLEARRLWGFIASVLIQPRHPAVRAYVFPLMPSYAAPAFSVWAVDSSCPYPSSFGSVCGVPAKAKKEKMELAGLLQRPQRRKWSLQDFCKCPKGENGACRTSANAPKGKMELAELLQMPQRGKRSLQNFCKRPKGENGACRTSANAPKEKTELAELLQTLAYS